MTNRSSRRRYMKSQDRRVLVFSELNHDLRHEQIARIITAAGLEQARLEAEARAEAAAQAAQDRTPRDEEDDHA